MGFFDKFKEVASDFASVAGKKGKEFCSVAGDKISDAADKTGKKGKELYNIAGFKIEIANKQNAIKKIYREIGEAAYEAYSEKADIVSAIAESLAKISALENEIEALKEKIEQEKSLEEVGVDDIPAADSTAEEAEFTADNASEFDASEVEPMDTID